MYLRVSYNLFLGTLKNRFKTNYKMFFMNVRATIIFTSK